MPFIYFIFFIMYKDNLLGHTYIKLFINVTFIILVSKSSCSFVFFVDRCNICILNDTSCFCCYLSNDWIICGQKSNFHDSSMKCISLISRKFCTVAGKGIVFSPSAMQSQHSQQPRSGSPPALGLRGHP